MIKGKRIGFFMLLYYIIEVFSGCGAVGLARLVWDEEAAGSSPVTPTEVNSALSPNRIYASAAN